MADEEYKIVDLNLLAFPRNQQPVCALTGLRAKVSLSAHGLILYYASRDMAEQAWLGIIGKIIHLLPPLIQPAPIVGTQEERARRKKNISLSKRALIEFCSIEASNLLSVKKYRLVIPAATQALKFCTELDGERSLSSVEPYLQLAHSHLGLNELKKAEELLSTARWIVLNNSSECSENTHSYLHMLVGRVFAAEGNMAGAKTEFAKAIYYSAKKSGAESVATSVGYFRLADVFLLEANIESALAFFDKVVDIWFKHLTALRLSAEADGPASNSTNTTVMGAQTAPSGSVNTAAAEVMTTLSEEVISDGYNQLEKILEHRRQLLGKKHIATGESQYTLGLFEFYMLRNLDSAYKLLASSHAIYLEKLGPDSKATIDVGTSMDLVSKGIVEKSGADHLEAVQMATEGDSLGPSADVSVAQPASELDDPEVY